MVLPKAIPICIIFFLIFFGDFIKLLLFPYLIARFILITMIILYKGISGDPTCVYFNSFNINDKAEQEVWRTERLFD